MRETGTNPTATATSSSCSGHPNIASSTCTFLFIGLPLIAFVLVILISACIFWGTRRRRAILRKRNKSMGRQRAETLMLTTETSEASEADLEKKRAWERWWNGKSMSPVETVDKSAGFRRLSYESYASMTLQGSCHSLEYQPSASRPVTASYSIKTSFEDVELEDSTEIATYPLPPLNSLRKEVSDLASEEGKADAHVQHPQELAVKPYLRIMSWPPVGGLPEIRLEAVIDDTQTLFGE